MVYFSQLKNSCVFDSKNVCIGKLIDLVFVDGTNYAEITHLIYQDESRYKKKISWDFVEEFKEDEKGKNGKISIYLNLPIEEVTPFFMKEKEVIVGDILDKQVIDVSGVKVVRVNDVILGKLDSKFYVIAVCVGASSFLRRLGIGPLSNIPSSKIQEHIIQWKSVERLEPEFHDLHLKVQKDKIEDLHPEDIADIMEDLSHSQRILIFNSLDQKKAAKTLLKAEENVQDSVLKSFKLKKIKGLLENIPADQAADIISLMPHKQGEEILNSMDKKYASKIRRILNYYPESIGSIMKTDFIAIPNTHTAQKTINLLRKLKLPSNRIYHLYVVDKHNHLMGVLPIRALLIADPNSKITSSMNKKVFYVRANNPIQTATRLMARYDLFVLPVIDKDGVLRGIIKADDVLDEYIPERLKRERFLPLKLRNRHNGLHKKD